MKRNVLLVLLAVLSTCTPAFAEYAPGKQLPGAHNHPLVLAIQAGDLGEVQSMLKGGDFSPNDYVAYTPDDRESLLQIAIYYNASAIVDYLLSLPSLNPNLYGERIYEESPIEEAINNYHACWAVQAIVSRRPDLNPNPPPTERDRDNVVEAARAGQTCAVVALMRSKVLNPNLRERGSSGCSFLNYAVQTGDLAMVNAILAHESVDPNQRCTDRAIFDWATPLIAAARFNFVDIARSILKHPATIVLLHDHSTSERTAADWAKANGNHELYELLKSKEPH